MNTNNIPENTKLIPLPDVAYLALKSLKGSYTVCVLSTPCAFSLSISATMLYYLSKETRNTEHTTSKVQEWNLVPSFLVWVWSFKFVRPGHMSGTLHALVVKEGT